jgi:hypothetical protein
MQKGRINNLITTSVAPTKSLQFHLLGRITKLLTKEPALKAEALSNPVPRAPQKRPNRSPAVAARLNWLLMILSTINHHQECWIQFTLKISNLDVAPTLWTIGNRVNDYFNI